jgi:hypothetical protein
MEVQANDLANAALWEVTTVLSCDRVRPLQDVIKYWSIHFSNHGVWKVPDMQGSGDVEEPMPVLPEFIANWMNRPTALTRSVNSRTKTKPYYILKPYVYVRIKRGRLYFES